MLARLAITGSAANARLSLAHNTVPRTCRLTHVQHSLLITRPIHAAAELTCFQRQSVTVELSECVYYRVAQKKWTTMRTVNIIDVNCCCSTMVSFL